MSMTNGIKKNVYGKGIEMASRSPHEIMNLMGDAADKKSRHPKKFIQKAIKHPGALHKDLGVPQGEKIPAKKLNKALRSENPTIRKRAQLAKTLKGMHHG